MADRLNRRLPLDSSDSRSGAFCPSVILSPGRCRCWWPPGLSTGSPLLSVGTVNVALIATLVPRSRLSEGVGYYGLANIFATAIGPSLGLGIGEAMGFQISFIISSIVIACGLVLSLFIHVKSPAQLPGRRGIHLEDLISLRVLPLAILGGIFFDEQRDYHLLSGALGGCPGNCRNQRLLYLKCPGALVHPPIRRQTRRP